MWTFETKKGIKLSEEKNVYKAKFTLQGLMLHLDF